MGRLDINVDTSYVVLTFPDLYGPFGYSYELIRRFLIYLDDGVMGRCRIWGVRTVRMYHGPFLVVLVL